MMPFFFSEHQNIPPLSGINISKCSSRIGHSNATLTRNHLVMPVDLNNQIYNLDYLLNTFEDIFLKKLLCKL